MIRRLSAEAVGTAFLLIAVIGSGIMGETLADGNIAIALLANAIATGCMLYAIITTLQHVGGSTSRAREFVVRIRKHCEFQQTVRLRSKSRLAIRQE